MKKILVFGSVNMDHVYYVDKLPNKGQCILSKSFNTFCGGKGANQAIAISRLNGNVEMVAMVGADDNGEKAIENLKANNVKTSNVEINHKIPTGVANIIVDDNGDNILIVNVGANFAFTKNDINKYKKLIDDYDIVVSQLEISLDFIEELLKYASLAQKIVILNPGPALKIKDEILKYCDFIIPNESELAILIGEKYSEDLEVIKTYAKSLQLISKKNIIVTLGDKGSIFVDINNNISIIDAYKIKCVDATAAGDTFIGGFVLKLALDVNIKEAILFATAASALTVQKKGAQVSIPNYKDVEEFIKKQGKVNIHE
ncbi:ribokinase [Spiroplasma endosymbiont of Aspidapion aeneum]|uniref:ribokinase n=1 Tax=Spiroplasma endosymbiont of Aspidapion aeneum TaxID=3066276 RepID=UPI00313E1FA4